MTEAYPGIDRTPMFAELQRCMVERRSAIMENQFTFPDGSTRWFELRIQPVPEGICVYSSDIDARKRREAARDSARSRGQDRPPMLERIRQFLRGHGGPV
jgi:hypothetical protein